MARNGFIVDETFVSQTEANVDWFDDLPSTARLYLDADGTPRDEGTVLRNPDLAGTYRRIARGGADAFYSRPIADAIADAARRPPMAPGRRPCLAPRADDRRATLLATRAPEREPTHVRHRGLDVWSMGPPSSGGSTVGEALNILEGYPDLASDRTRALHLFLEASRFSFADRNAFLADPGFFDVPLAGLLSDDFAAQRRAQIDEQQAATSPVAPGDPGAPGEGSATVVHRGQSTTHLVVADRHGTVVSYTFTIESTGGNGIVVPGYGFLLNNELTDFNIDALDHPNSADGGKRPRSSMAPTIVTRHGRPFLAVGSPGARRSSPPSCRCCSSASTWARPCRRRSPGRAPASATRPPPRPSRPSSSRPRALALDTQLRPGVQAGRGARRRYRPGAPARRPRARRRRAGAPRRRQRRCRAALEFRGVRPQTRRALALGCLATVAAADYVLHRRKPRWILIGLFDHPAHLATAGLVVLNATAARGRWTLGFLAGSLLPDLDHLPLAAARRAPVGRRPAPRQPLPARGRARRRPGRR